MRYLIYHVLFPRLPKTPVIFWNQRYATFFSLMVLALSFAISLPGCGKSRELAPVTGKVTYRGQPLRFGRVVFQPASGQFASGDIQPDGTFCMITQGEGDGAPVGENQVRIVCFEGEDPNRKKRTGGVPDEIVGFGKSLIPKKYASCSTSGIVVNVQSGTNDPVIIELKDN